MERESGHWQLKPQRISHYALRPTRLTIDLNHLVKNYRLIQQYCSRPVMAVIKADAYGHGIVPVAQRLEQEGVAYFGVAYLEEALLLREENILTPILVMGGILSDRVHLYIKHGITLTASSVEKLLAIEKTAKQLKQVARVHLKIDTGMGRIGVQPQTAEELFTIAKECTHIETEGLFTHFANADAEDLRHAVLQCERFQKALECAEKMGLQIPLIHMSNSGALVQLPESLKTMVRVGIMLYGVYPSSAVPKTIPIKPLMRWTSKVVYFKVLPANTPIGYGSTWVTPKQTRIVTIPVGYGDGYHRRMSGKAEVLIHGKRYPVVGTICMDQIMVDIGWDEVFNGEEVVLLGEQDAECITVDEMAMWAETITYEILTSINLRVARVYLHVEQLRCLSHGDF